MRSSSGQKGYFQLAQGSCDPWGLSKSCWQLSLSVQSPTEHTFPSHQSQGRHISDEHDADICLGLLYADSRTQTRIDTGLAPSSVNWGRANRAGICPCGAPGREPLGDPAPCRWEHTRPVLSGSRLRRRWRKGTRHLRDAGRAQQWKLKGYYTQDFPLTIWEMRRIILRWPDSLGYQGEQNENSNEKML